jgi:hypothetical protein
MMVESRTLTRFPFEAGSKLFSLFQIHWDDLNKIEYILLKHLNLQPSELERLPFHRVESLIKNFKEDNEKENARRAEEEKKQKAEMGDVSNLKKQQKNITKSHGMPKMPKMPKFKM